MTVRAVAARVAGAAARRYIAGPELEDALRVEAALRERGGVRAVVGYWDAAGETPAAVAGAYAAAIDAVAGRDGVEVALKPPALGGDPARLLELARHAAAAGVALHCDALAIDAADAALDLAAGAPGVGVTLPGRWRRSVDDADRAAALGASVRVVKGQWADPSAPCRDPGAGFLAVVDRLAGSAVRRVGVATHDGALAALALRRLAEAGTECELQLLFGLPAERPLAATRDLGVPVRAYIPYGRAYLPYALSAVRRRPVIAAWLARDLARRRREWAPA